MKGQILTSGREATAMDDPGEERPSHGGRGVVNSNLEQSIRALGTGQGERPGDRSQRGTRPRGLGLARRDLDGDRPGSEGGTDLPLLQKSRHVGIIVIADVLLLFPWRWGGFARRVGRAGPRRREQQKVRGTQKQEDRAQPAGGRHVSRPA